MLVNLLVRQFKKPYFCAHILAHSDENFSNRYKSIKLSNYNKN